MNEHWQNKPAYFLALEVGNYRACLREALAAYRRTHDPVWRWRLWGAFKSRHR